MKRITFLLSFFTFCNLLVSAQVNPAATLQDIARMPSKVDFDVFEKLTKEVKEYRKNRLVSLAVFNEYAKDKNTIILDTRSAEMYKRKHVKGAINLNFSDFTQYSLASIIRSTSTRILIYCNNNFDNDPINFATKSAKPVIRFPVSKKLVTLALNIPTFINLYGYGYKNVYELADYVSVFDKAIAFEGTDVTPVVRGAATIQ